MHGSMIKYVLFDFDGTLVDSKEVFISAFNHIAHKYHFKKIGPGNIDHLRNLSMMDRFRYLNVPLYKLPLLTNEFLSLYRSAIGSLALIPGMGQVLKKITDLSLDIGIVSSNSAATIRSFVAHNEIPGITDVYCSGKLFGKDRVFRKFLKDKKLSGCEVLYVCDELRDISACNKVQVKPIWVSWGFELEQAVKGGNALHTVHTPDELFAIIEHEYLRCL
jgi:phosphoglycolate phosphatase